MLNHAKCSSSLSSISILQIESVLVPRNMSKIMSECVFIYILFKYQHMTQHSYVMSIYYIFLVCQHLRQNLLRWWGSYRAKYMIFLFLTVMGQSSSMRHETNPPHVQSSVENWINARSRKITNRIGDFEKSNLFPAPNLSKMQQKWPLGF